MHSTICPKVKPLDRNLVSPNHRQSLGGLQRDQRRSGQWLHIWHTNEYYTANSSSAWNTRIGAFRFTQCVPIPNGTLAGTITNANTAAAISGAVISVSNGASMVSSATGTYTRGIQANTYSVTVSKPGFVSQIINNVTITDGNTTTVNAALVPVGNVRVTATAGNVGPVDYTLLKDAFDAINAGTHQGSITVSILGDTVETAAAVLNASGTGSASYTDIGITPSGVRTVSGAIAAGSPLIDLSGADNVTIDGLNTGGNSLTLANTTVGTTASTSTIRFLNGATSNVIKNCTILGSSTATAGNASGNVLFSTSTVAGGNSNNTISNNNIGPAGTGTSLPSKGVYGLGTAANPNTGNLIDGNNIYDVFAPGASHSVINVQANNSNWTISNNRIYQTAQRQFTTTALRYAGITVNAPTGNFTITGNTIGFANSAGTGVTTIIGSSNEVRGIDLQAANTSPATSVQGNTISGITQTSSRASTTIGLSAFIGISLSTSAGAQGAGLYDIGGTTGNTIGSLDGSSGIVINETSTTANTARIVGILVFDSANNIISNNNIGTLTINSGGTGTTVGFSGILLNTSSGTPTMTVSNNTIGGTGANSIIDNIVGDYAMYAIAKNAGTADLTVTGNTVRNMTGNATSNATGTVVMSGIVSQAAGTGVTTISRNTVHSLTNNAVSAFLGAIYAIDMTLPSTANVVERNLVHSISLTSGSNNSQLVGIIMRGAGSATYRNNMVRLGLNAAGASITSGISIRGIVDTAGATADYYFNSVYIGGSGVASASNSLAFTSSVVTNVHSIQDNIFWNARSNASGAGKNYAISVAGTAPNPPGLTSNNNDLYATGTGGFVGLFNAADQLALSNWQTATGLDAASISANPLFVAPNGTASTVDLHIQAGSPCINAGVTIAGITNDFDNDTRDAAPDIGADEIVAAASATTLTADAATGSYGGTVNLTATLTDGVNPVSGKTIAFTLNGGGVGSAVTNGSGVASLTSVSLAGINAGAYPTGVGASFAGDVNYLASNGSNSLTVNKGDTTTVVTANNASYDGNPHGGTANVTGPGGLNQAVTVSYSGRNATVYGPTNTAPTNAGDYTASAAYAGDSNYNPSNDSKDYSIAKADTTTTVTANNATYDGNPHGGTANVTGPGGLNQAVTVSYSGRNATVYGPTNTAPTNAGDYMASASYAGDSNYNPSNDSKDYSIAKATPVITWNNPANIVYGTALGGTQLNASTGCRGFRLYTPASGTVLS